MEIEKIGRRKFLTDSAMAALGYTACVAIPSGCASTTTSSKVASSNKASIALPKPMGKPAYKSEIGKRINDVVNGNKIKFRAFQKYTPASIYVDARY